MEKLWRFAFEGVSDELEDPADYKEHQGNFPESRDKQRRDDEKQGEDDHRNPDGVAEAISGILMT